MPFDMSALPIGGGTLLAAAIYGAASLGSGQIIADRMIEKSGWEGTCQSGIVAAHDAREREKSFVPEARCGSILGMFHPELNKLCRELGNPDFNTWRRQSEERLRQQRRAITQDIRNRLAATAGSQCACATSLYKSEKMISLGVYAGSARVITPAPVENLEGELTQALATPQCQAIGE